MQICEPYELHNAQRREENDGDIAMQVCEPYELCKTEENEVIYDIIQESPDVTESDEDYI